MPTCLTCKKCGDCRFWGAITPQPDEQEGYCYAEGELELHSRDETCNTPDRFVRI